MFFKHGLGSVVLTLEPSRYEHCGGSKRSDDLREFLEQGPGLLTRQAMLRTPFVWIQVRRSRMAELFRPRFAAECHLWLNEPLPAYRQRLAHLLYDTFDQMNVCFAVVNLGPRRSGCFALNV